MPSERVGDTVESTTGSQHTSVSTSGGGAAASQPPSQQASSKGTQDGTASSGSPDPETLVAEIEATREDLAEKLDAIADRVSPKRVAERSKDQARDLAAQAKEFVAEKAGHAKEVVTEKAAVAKGAVAEKTASAKTAVSERTSHGSTASSVAVAGDAAPDGGLPPTRGVEVPVLSTRPTSSTSSTGPLPGPLANVPKEALVGAVAALVALFLLSRRRH